jgi:hypothetical protein
LLLPRIAEITRSVIPQNASPPPGVTPNRRLRAFSRAWCE